MPYGLDVLIGLIKHSKLLSAFKSHTFGERLQFVLIFLKIKTFQPNRVSRGENYVC